MPIRVALVEDDVGTREGLVALLGLAEDVVCVGAFGSVEEVLADLPEADVVLLDINLPGQSGIEGARLLKVRQPALQIIMLTVYEDTDRIFQALKAGATGYLLKRTTPSALLDAVADVHAGGSPMSGQIARKVVQSFQSRSAVEEANLTPREREILGYLAKGYLYKEIADRLHISTETVRSHLRHVYEKLEVRTRTEAVVKYLGG